MASCRPGRAAVRLVPAVGFCSRAAACFGGIERRLAAAFAAALEPASAVAVGCRLWSGMSLADCRPAAAGAGLDDRDSEIKQHLDACRRRCKSGCFAFAGSLGLAFRGQARHGRYGWTVDCLQRFAAVGGGLYGRDVSVGQQRGPEAGSGGLANLALRRIRLGVADGCRVPCRLCGGRSVDRLQPDRPTLFLPRPVGRGVPPDGGGFAVLARGRLRRSSRPRPPRTGAER